MHSIKFIALSLLTAGCFSAQAQFDNMQFENWAVTDTTWNGEPVYTASHWGGGKRTTDSYNGNFAARVEPYMACGIARNYMVYSSTNQHTIGFTEFDATFTGLGEPIQFKPVVLSGYFKFLSPQPDDLAIGIVKLRKFNAATGHSEEVGSGEIIFTPSLEYAPFTIAITDLQPNVMPDSIVIAFSSGMGFSWDDLGSTYGTLYIDGLRVQKGGTASNPDAEISLIETSFYPNPSEGLLNFSFHADVSDDFLLVITDPAGREIIRRAVQPDVQTRIEMGPFRAGAYIATLQGKNKIYGTKTLIRN